MREVWTPANLSEQQLDVIKEAEQALESPINIRAFEPIQGNPASLNASQTECLQGLEKKLGMGLVALQKQLLRQKEQDVRFALAVLSFLLRKLLVSSMQK